MRLVPVAYLASSLLSLLGTSIASVALPLIVLHVTGVFTEHAAGPLNEQQQHALEEFERRLSVA
ncbi:hypothetical protein [Microbacterium sp.]|uniref:hypothetical protein n=1 Tax=Microbacterium sp. TaxID=51671 RepID=UPI0039E3C4BC